MDENLLEILMLEQGENERAARRAGDPASEIFHRAQRQRYGKMYRDAIQTRRVAAPTADFVPSFTSPQEAASRLDEEYMRLEVHIERFGEMLCNKNFFAGFQNNIETISFDRNLTTLADMQHASIEQGNSCSICHTCAEQSVILALRPPCPIFD